MLIELVPGRQSVEQFISLVLNFEELDGVCKISNRFGLLTFFREVLFCFGFRFGTVKETIDIFFGHQIFFVDCGGLLFIFDGFVEFSRAVFPQLV